MNNIAVKNFMVKENLSKFFFTPIDGTFLALFRIIFGIVMFFEFRGFYGYFIGPIQQSKFYFTSDFFHWIKLIDVESLAILYIILFISLFFLSLDLNIDLQQSLFF